MGQRVVLRVTILNTGTVVHRFTVSAVVSREAGQAVETFQATLVEPLRPGQRRAVEWTYAVGEPGDVHIQYLLRRGGPAEGYTLLDTSPSSPQALILGRPLPMPTTTVTLVVAPPAKPSPTPTPTQVTVSAPTATLTAVPTATLTALPTATPTTPIPSQGTDASISGFSPSNVVSVDVGGNVVLSATVANTGVVARQFLVGATVMDSEGTSVGDYSTVLGAPLEPGDQTEVAWDHQVSSSGDYSVQFSVWEGTPPTEQTLLDREPASPQTLIVASFAPMPSPTPHLTPTVVPAPAVSPSPTATPTELGAQFVSHSPSTLQFGQISQSVLLSATIQNTRNIAWRFVVRARVTQADGTLVAEYVRSLSSALEPGQDTTLSWTHLPQGPGDFFLQFAVAKDSSFSGTSLMDSAPGTPELLIKVQSF